MSYIWSEITFHCCADQLPRNQISDRISHDIPPQMKILITIQLSSNYKVSYGHLSMGKL